MLPSCQIAITIDRVDRRLDQGAQLGPTVLDHTGAHVEQHEGCHTHEHGREDSDDEKEFLADGQSVQQHFDPDHCQGIAIIKILCVAKRLSRRSCFQARSLTSS